MQLTVIVPAYNCIPVLRQCLAALQAQAGPEMEIIVVDDASTDATPVVAAETGVRVIHASRNGGPGMARNLGASVASGNILLFVDSDVVIGPGVLRRVVETFSQQPRLAALFGSYDDKPEAKSLVSTFRNLLHHYTHQTGNPEAATFWAGLGAVKRQVFREIRGFDEVRFHRPSIEDIELGYRLKRAGHSILLDRHLQAKHLKKWTLKSMVVTDVFCRAIPWTRLLLEHGHAEKGLNLKFGQRASGALILFATLMLHFSWWEPKMLWGVGFALLLVIANNFRLYGFFQRAGGLVFAMACIPLHFLYLLYSTLSYLYVRVGHMLRRSVSQTKSTPNAET